MRRRQELLYRFWGWVEPSLDGYSDAIRALLKTLTDDQLEAFLDERTDREDEEDEDE